jgi:dihydrodipicolinate synthase/N-acetylneuraminate lyase
LVTTVSQHTSAVANRDSAASRFAGVVAAFITPCSAPGEIDIASTSRLAGELTTRGCDGIFAVSSTGESPFIDECDRRTLIAAARDGCAAGATLYAGISATGAKQAIRYARNAAADGAAAEEAQRKINSLWTMFKMPEMRVSFSYFARSLKLSARLRGWIDATETMIGRITPDPDFDRAIAGHLQESGLIPTGSA